MQAQVQRHKRRPLPRDMCLISLAHACAGTKTCMSGPPGIVRASKPRSGVAATKDSLTSLRAARAREEKCDGVCLRTRADGVQVSENYGGFHDAEER